jgi:ribonuclease HI
MEQSECVIDFEKRSMIKSHVLPDFIAEWTKPSPSTDGIVLKAPWLIYCHGAWGNTGDGVSAILVSPSGIKCTNNIAEYEAILLGLHKLRAIGVQTCTLRTDSRVVAGQLEKECITRGPTLERYWALIRRMERYFKGFTVEYIERTKNTETDELARAIARNRPLPADVFFQVISDASIKIVEAEPRVINLIQGEDWRAAIMAYLHHYYEPDSTTKHTRMQ